ncbi:MAG: hypothetical protein MUC37_02755 [Hyphomicrobium sp.]|nr:hypothetical protein [Hyphomicrobium sp.]
MSVPFRAITALAVLLMTACTSSQEPASVATADLPTQDAATRTAPVVPGRPARVFVFAGWDNNCAATAAPVVTVTKQPAQGDISLRPGQETTIAASAVGTCAGRSVAGTGVYYTARAGATGTDSFSVEARLASGETSRRNFEVTIAN